MTDWSTTVYYTFSTVSQTLAGAVGLLAAFIIIRLGSLRAALHEKAVIFNQTVDHGDPALEQEAYRLFAKGDDAALVRLCRSQPGHWNATIYGQHVSGVHLPIAEQLLAQMHGVTVRLWVALGLTAVTIVASVVVLSMTPLVVSSGLHRQVLTLAVVATIVCVASYIEAIRHGVRV
jgi:hypothetical protein